MTDKYRGGIAAGSTSVSMHLILRKKADNQELTALAYNTAGNIASYCRQGGTRVAITLATQTPGAAWATGGFCLIDDTNMPGLYRLDVPDAAFAAGVDYVTIGFVTTSGYAYYERIPLTTDPVQTGDTYGALTGAQAEPTSVPAANATPLAKLGYLFTKARNKITQTSNTQLLRNDADSATIATSTLSDDLTTFIKGKDA